MEGTGYCGGENLKTMPGSRVDCRSTRSRQLRTATDRAALRSLVPAPADLANLTPAAAPSEDSTVNTAVEVTTEFGRCLSTNPNSW